MKLGKGGWEVLVWWEAIITTSSRPHQILRENIENNQSKGMHTKNRLGLSRWAETCLGWDHFSSIRKLRRKFRVGANPAESGLASKFQEPRSQPRFISHYDLSHEGGGDLLCMHRKPNSRMIDYYIPSTKVHLFSRVMLPLPKVARLMTVEARMTQMWNPHVI
jgi:hypothetical protein